jgi:dihydrofolate reductase
VAARRTVYIDMKLTMQTFLTLDGVMQAPGGPEEDPSEAFDHGGWQAPFPDPAVGEFILELNSHASAFLFGRRTFDIFRSYWPDQTDPANAIATAINSLPKYVVSNTFTEHDATWRGAHPDTARLVTGDVVAAVEALKNEPGDELHSATARLGSPFVQPRHPPSDDAPCRHHRDRTRRRRRHL